MSINRYFFVSNTRLKDNTIYPRVPKNRLTESGLEDNTTPRICVGKSIIGCLASVGSYTKRKRLYLYQCFVDSDSVIQPTEKQVNDSIWTGEEWIVAPATMELVTILHVKKENICEKYYKYIIEDKRSMGFYHTEMIQYEPFSM